MAGRIEARVINAAALVFVVGFLEGLLGSRIGQR